MAEMEEAGEAMPAQAPEQGGGDNEAKTLIKGVSRAMGEVANMLPKIGGTEEDVAAMGDIISQYQQLVMKVVQGGGEAPAKAPAQGQAPAMGGPRGMPMGQ